MPDPAYYTSERFIHDELVRRAESAIHTLYETWKKERAVSPFLLCWPANAVTARDGSTITGACVLELPKDRSLWRSLLVDSVKVTNAYALLLVEQKEDHVQVTLESQHGSKCWKLKIVKRGVDRVLLRPTPSSDQEHIGILWAPDKGSA